VHLADQELVEFAPPPPPLFPRLPYDLFYPFEIGGSSDQLSAAQNVHVAGCAALFSALACLWVGFYGA
jgi:hypothetical protein